MKIHQLDGYIQSIFLVEYDDRLLLLDGGCRCDASVVTDFIEQQLGRSIRDLKTVLVTHMHPDHAGAAHALRQVTGCTVAMPRMTRHWYCGLRGFSMFLIDLLLAAAVGFRIGKPLKHLWYWPYCKPDVELVDGDHLPDFGDWQVWTTPGHTDHHLAAYHTTTRTVYAADLAVKVGETYMPPVLVEYPVDYRESLRRLRGGNIDTVLLAHGGQIADLDPAFFDDMLARVPAEPQTLRTLVGQFWTRAGKSVRRLANRV